MFERFTDRARRVVVLAQEESRCLKHDYIGTEHLLIALLNEGEGIAARALVALGQNANDIRDEVLEVVGEGEKVVPGHIPFTPRAKKVLELSLREALQLGHNYIGTEHLLLALIREGEGVAAQILVEKGVELVKARQMVLQLLGVRVPDESERIAGSDREAEIASLRQVADRVEDLRAELEDAAEKTLKARKEWIDALDQAGVRSDIRDALAKDLAEGTRTVPVPPRHAKRGDTYKQDMVEAIQAEANVAEAQTLGGTYDLRVGGGGVGGGGGGGFSRATAPKVSVDQGQFEEVKRRLAYVVTDPFSGEVKLYPLKWTGRVITGVDWGVS